MPVVLGNDTGERVLLYGSDGSTLRALVADGSGRLVVVGVGAGGAVEVIQDTAADLRTAAYGIDGSTQRQIAVDGSGRPRMSEPRERSPLKITAAYLASGVAPHAATIRWSYTVPASRRAILEALECEIVRETAATTNGLFNGLIDYTPSGGSITRVLDAAVLSNTVGASQHLVLGPALLLLAGDLLRGRTVDASTDGTIRYIITAALTEFDA